MARLAVVLSLLAMASCASIVSPGPDELSVRSAPEGAQVTLDGVVAGKTPCTVLIDRKQAGILLIELEGHGPVTVKRDKVTNGWYYGNIFIGVSSPARSFISSATDSSFSNARAFARIFSWRADGTLPRAQARNLASTSAGDMGLLGWPLGKMTSTSRLSPLCKINFTTAG